MRHIIESMESAWEEVEFFEAILEADDDLLDEVFDDDDVAHLEHLAQLISAAEAGALSEDQDDVLEGLKSWLTKKKKQFVRKLPPGTKMVFGKIVKVGKAVGKAAGTAARGAQTGARKVVAAKRAVQGAAYRFTDAGKKARAAAKKVSDTKGRKAGEASWQASKQTYKKNVKAGESHTFAASQAQKAGSRTAGSKPKLTKPVAAPNSKTMPGTGARKKGKPTQATGPAKKGAPRKRKANAKMEDIFNKYNARVNKPMDSREARLFYDALQWIEDNADMVPDAILAIVKQARPGRGMGRKPEMTWPEAYEVLGWYMDLKGTD